MIERKKASKELLTVLDNHMWNGQLTVQFVELLLNWLPDDQIKEFTKWLKDNDYDDHLPETND